ncbi:tail completion protein gp17 [Burkholderia ubonensis]|uniref:tail completion protein gp17 n=1 Tax=Burkholderia ubonensis TaxID=101571 RepID=UPI00075DCAED|nr:DUF3168 domain-containing protein [Burkholderia ubonensis]KVO11719.1 hypothetical protein WJ73_19410 [Burkholderia ubonensis]
MANSAEAIVVGALKSLVDNGDGTFRCYPDEAPANVHRPYIVYQSAGGKSTSYLTETVSSQQNSRMQVAAWADDRLTADAMMQAIIAALCIPPINATSMGAPASVRDFDTKLYGSRLDFSIWFTP